MKVLDSLTKQASSIAAIRRDIHAHPELCFEEIRTADLVAQKLTEWGIPSHRGLGTTGVVFSCFDPEPTVNRQARTYMGRFAKAVGARGRPKPGIMGQDFQIESFI